MTDSSERESRHVLVSGIPESWTEDEIITHFGDRVQRVERTTAQNEFMVSFYDVRSARKNIADNIDTNIKMKFYEPENIGGGYSTVYSTENDKGSNSNSISPTLSNERNNRSFSFHDDFKRKQSIGTNPNSPKNKTSPSSTSSGDRRFSLNDDSLNMLRRTSRADSDFEPTIYTIRFEKLPSTLLVPWDKQKKEITELVNKYGSTKEIAVDEIDNEAKDRKATLFCSLQPGITIDQLMDKIKSMHIETNPVIARQLTCNETIGMKTTNPGTILTIPRSSGSIDYYSGPSSATINPSFNSFLPTDLSHIKPDDKNASRTLHVRNLDRRITADLLKEKFGKYHDVIDVEIKNPESPSPYAFIQFPDVMSVIDTIHQYYKNENDRNKYRYKLNWGKTKTSSKLWLGKLPENITKEYIRTKIRSGLILDDITDIILDSQKCEAIVMFKHKDPAMKILEQIKSKQIVFNFDRSSSTLVHVDYCSDKLQEYFTNRLTNKLPQSSTTATNNSFNQPLLHGFTNTGPLIPILIDTSQPPPPLPGNLPPVLVPPPEPPKNIFEISGCTAISSDLDTTIPSPKIDEMGHSKKYYKSPSRRSTPEYERRRTSEHRHHRDHHHRRSRSRERKYTRDYNDKRKERRRSKSLSSVSSTNSGHHYERKKDVVSPRIEPPPMPPTIDTKNDGQQQQIRRNTNEQSQVQPHFHQQQQQQHQQQHYPPKLMMPQMNQSSNVVKPKIPTPKKVYFGKPFRQPYRIVEMDPRPKIRIKKNETRILLRGWAEAAMKKISMTKETRKDNPAPIERPRISSGGTGQTVVSRVQDRLEQMKKKDEFKKAANLTQLHVDTTTSTSTTNVEGTVVSTPLSGNRIETLQHTLSTVSLMKSPMTNNSPILKSGSASNLPTPSPISRQTSMISNQNILQNISSPISNNSALSTPKTSTIISPKASTTAMTTNPLVKRIGQNSTTTNANNRPEKSSFVFPTTTTTKPNVTTPISKLATPTTPQIVNKFGTPTTNITTPTTPQNKSKLSIGQNKTNPQTTEKKSIQEKKSTSLFPGILTNTTPKMSEKHRSRKESVLSSSTSSEYGKKEKKKKKSMIQEDKTDDITDRYLKQLQEASNSSKNYDKDKEKRKQEKKEAKRRQREMEEKLQMMKEMKKKEKKKKKKRDEYDSDSCDSIEKAHKNKINKDYQTLLQDGFEPTTGLSMYDRVKRRTSGVQNDDASKKREALELIKKKKEKELKKIRATTDEISENDTPKQPLQPAISSTSISMSIDHDSEATSSAKSETSSLKKKKIGIIEKERFEEKKRKKEKERKEKEKMEQKTKEKRENETKEERKARKLEKKKLKESLQNLLSKSFGTTDDESDKMTNKSSKKATDSDNDSGHVGSISRKESLPKKERQQKNVLKRLTRRETSDSEDEVDSPKIKSNIDMSDVFGGDSGDESTSQPILPSESVSFSSVKSKDEDAEKLKRKQEKKERKLAKEKEELEKKKEEKRLRKEQKKKEQEAALLAEKEAKRKRKEEKKRLLEEQRKEEKRKAKEERKKEEEERLEAEKKARKEARKARKLAEESSRKRKNTTDEEISLETSRPRKEAKMNLSSPETSKVVIETKEEFSEPIVAPIPATPSNSAISIVIPPTTPSPSVFSSPMSNSFLRTPKSTIPKKPSPLTMPPPPIPASPLTSPMRQRVPSVNTTPLVSAQKSPTSTLDSSTTSIEQQLPPIREETPIPTPLIPYERKISNVSLGLSLSSSDTSADEHALLLAMNQDQETTQAAEVVQKQMEQEEIGIDSYHYGAARFIDKKRESDVSSIDADYIKRRFSLDRRSSQEDVTSMQSSFIRPNLQQQNIQSPLFIQPNLINKSLTPDAMNFLSTRHGISSPIVSPLAQNNDLLRRQAQLGQIGKSQSGLMISGQSNLQSSGQLTPGTSLLTPNVASTSKSSISPKVSTYSGLFTNSPQQNVGITSMTAPTVPTPMTAPTVPLMGPPPLPVNINPFQFPTTGSTASKSATTTVPTTNVVPVSTTIPTTSTFVSPPTTTPATTTMATMKTIPIISVSSLISPKPITATSTVPTNIPTTKPIVPAVTKPMPTQSSTKIAPKPVVPEKTATDLTVESVPSSSKAIPVHILKKAKELPKITPNVILPPMMAPIPRCSTRNLTWDELYPEFTKENDGSITTRKRPREETVARTRPITVVKKQDGTEDENAAKKMRTTSPTLNVKDDSKICQPPKKLGYYRSDSLLSLAVSDTGVDSDYENDDGDENHEKMDILEKEDDLIDDIEIETFPQIFSDIPPVPIPDDYDEETVRILKRYPSIFEGVLTFKDKATSIHFHSVAFYKNDFRPFLREPLSQYTPMYDLNELRIRQRCSLSKEGRIHSIFKATVITQQVPFHLLIGVSGVTNDNSSDIDGETDVTLRPLFELSNLSNEKVGCVVAANNPLQRDVALYMMYESRITDHILNDYAKDLLVFLKESGMNYCLGLLCYDFLNNPKITLHEWSNRIPVSLPNYHTDPRAFKNRWLLSHPSFAPPGTPITENLIQAL